ncbi:MAG: glycosyltransferase [Bacteroidota bacterium]
MVSHARKVDIRGGLSNWNRVGRVVCHWQNGLRIGLTKRRISVALKGTLLVDKSYYSHPRPDVLALVPTTARKVLDIGCGTGELGRLLKRRQRCHVHGIEVVAEAAQEASRHLDMVINDDALRALSTLPADDYDCVVLADVLEHLIDPEKALLEAARVMKDGSSIVVSVPNITHWSVIQRLLNGVWRYEDAGILDRTHVRFFTRQGIISLLEDVGFQIEQIQLVTTSLPDFPERLVSGLQAVGVNVNRFLDEARTYQHLVRATVSKAVKTSSGEVVHHNNTSHPQVVYPDISENAGHLAADVPRLSIVVPVRNGVQHTRRFVDGLMHHWNEDYELVIVDNASTDNTEDFINSLRQKINHLVVIRNSRNLGFGAAMNQGVRAARGEFLLLANNDIIIPRVSLEVLLTVAKMRDDIGIVGPRTNECSGRQRVDWRAYPHRSILPSHEEVEAFATSWSKSHSGLYSVVQRLVGFCLLVKRRVFEVIGGFDLRFGIGNFEDDDFCRRAILAGFQAVIAHEAFVHHTGSSTFKAESIDYAKLMSANAKVFAEKWQSGVLARLWNDAGSPSTSKEHMDLLYEPLCGGDEMSAEWLTQEAAILLRHADSTSGMRLAAGIQAGQGVEGDANLRRLQALALLRRAHEIEPTLDTLRNVANILLLVNRPVEAARTIFRFTRGFGVGVFDLPLTELPSLGLPADLFHTLGLAYLAMKEPQYAKVAFETAVRLEPNNDVFLHDLRFADELDRGVGPTSAPSELQPS